MPLKNKYKDIKEIPAEDVRLALDQALKDAGVAPPDHKPATEATAPSK